MEKTIKSIEQVRKELDDISCGPFLLTLKKFMNEETAKPYEEIDTEFLKYCTDTYLEVYEKSKQDKILK